MNHAKCIEDGHIYSAVEFSGLNSTDLARKRRLLQCPECGGPAFYRNMSPIGRAPCFGARPHAPRCSLSAYDQVHLLSMANEGIQLNSSAKIVVDFHYETPGQPDAMFLADKLRLTGDLSGGCRPDARLHRRPSSLLRLLVESPAFRDSDQPIQVLGMNGISVRDFFVPLLDVAPHHVGLFRGFWGFLSDVALKNNTVWFNSGGYDSVSFCMDAKFLDDFRQRYRVRCSEELAGAYILVIGTLRVAHSNKKLYCVIDAPEFMALKFT